MPDPTDDRAPVRRWVVWNALHPHAYVAQTEAMAWLRALGPDRLCTTPDQLRAAGWHCSPVAAEVRTDGR